MSMKTRLESLLEKGEFGEAASLLKSKLRDAQLIDPRNERTWSEYADKIAGCMQEQGGRSAAIAFWEDLLEFFINDLEPKWEHLHKGRIFFRLGWLTLVDDVSKGKQYLQEALKEAKIWWEEQEKRGNSRIPADEGVKRSSSYVTLCIIEGIEQAERSEERLFESDDEKRKFFEELSKSFDSAIFGEEVEPDLVLNAIHKILPTQAIKGPEIDKIKEQTNAIKKQLDQVRVQQLPVAVVSLAGALLESILLWVLYFDRGVREIKVKGKCKKGKRKNICILEVTLGRLVKEARDRSVFPSDSVYASCKLIQIFRNRIHAGNQLRSEYELTPRVAITLKNLFDRSIVDWGDTIDGVK